ncbi:hypothetical protein O181_070082 [Austropuccinia psidii MF-1]|uniref:Uncharacterized protein n=1 Tax=Austropuccinia psidii MF-1 TaxID=1389203 RepID=A0A9Q3I7X4_9BASI|nr:hypothetical protein [Austropuccinia psidii MF-1]
MWLLNLQAIESKLEEWHQNLSSCQGTVVFDIFPANLWQKMFLKSSSAPSLQLGFGLFVDWFNPRGNKIAGKQLSMGILALYCFNFQPQERFQPKYTCLAGIISSPNQPNMITINNVLKPLIPELIQLNNGIVITTPNYPQGQRVIVKLVGLIGDIVATHKVGGFMSHSAKYFFSWCELQDHERDQIKLGNLRKGTNVLGASWRWKDARTTRVQQTLSKTNGI